MSSMFDSEVYAARQHIQWADINADDLLRDLTQGEHEVKLEVMYRHSVRTRHWWTLHWTGEDGQRYAVDGETLQLCLWRAAVRERKTREQLKACDGSND